MSTSTPNTTASPEPVAASCRIAIFDLDGTLTTRSTFLPYLVTWGLRHRCYAALLGLPFRLCAYLLGLVRDAALKDQLMIGFLSGATRDELRQHTDWFCRSWLPRRRHPIGMRHLQEHQRRGDRIVLLSASPDVYVTDLARSLGISEVVCTRVAFEGGRCRGTIDGENCKGLEKRRAIAEYLGCQKPPAASFAYGDAQHDLAVLCWVKEGWLIRRRRSVLVERESQRS